MSDPGSNPRARYLAAAFLAALLTAGLLPAGCGGSFEATLATEATPRSVSPWPEYGGGGGRRHVEVSQIDADNVAALTAAWIYRHSDVSDGSTPGVNSTSAFQVTPIIANGQLVFCTPFNRVIALDPLTGGELWQFDPEIDLSGRYGNQLICRGVAQWHDEDPTPTSEICSSRIFTATNDGYLIALDAATGTQCTDFGDGGRIDLNEGAGEQLWLGEYQVTSAPTVIKDLVVVGAAISDNVRIDAPSGVIRAFDARTGAQAWAWDLAPPDFDYAAPDALVSGEGFALGTPNVWGTMTADADRDLLFVPTGNPAPDYYRSGKPDMDYYGTAVVALRASSGEVVWHFNTVRNDFWDFDVGAQPTLADLTIEGRRIPALIQGTKMGFVFVLNRETGEPVIDYENRTVPRNGPLTEQFSPTQPFPPESFQLAPDVGPDDAWGLTFWDEGWCEERLAETNVGPIYTPITEQWTVVAPSNAGGINWGGISVDAARGLIIARSSNIPFRVKLIPREAFASRSGHEYDVEFAEQRGMPYAMARETFLSPWGLPCTKPPWGTLTVIDIATQTQLWRIPHGTVRDLSPVPIPWEIGMPGLGAPLVTSSGLVFIGAAMENVLRAYDLDSGEELWKGELPAGPQATPMSYSVELEDGSTRQFVVIAAGGHARMGTKMGDHVVAFALP
jgi:quinoprotein glucose dehydrogenase